MSEGKVHDIVPSRSGRVTCHRSEGVTVPVPAAGCTKAVATVPASHEHRQVVVLSYPEFSSSRAHCLPTELTYRGLLVVALKVLSYFPDCGVLPELNTRFQVVIIALRRPTKVFGNRHTTGLAQLQRV